MRMVVLLALVVLSGCRTVVEAQPNAQAALVINPRCALVCHAKVVVQHFAVSASGEAPVTASPDMSISSKQEGGLHAAPPAPPAFAVVE